MLFIYLTLVNKAGEFCFTLVTKVVDMSTTFANPLAGSWGLTHGSELRGTAGQPFAIKCLGTVYG